MIRGLLAVGLKIDSPSVNDQYCMLKGWSGEACNKPLVCMASSMSTSMSEPPDLKLGLGASAISWSESIFLFVSCTELIFPFVLLCFRRESGDAY